MRGVNWEARASAIRNSREAKRRYKTIEVALRDYLDLYQPCADGSGMEIQMTFHKTIACRPKLPDNVIRLSHTRTHKRYNRRNGPYDAA
jgi:hypothetical protein